MEPSSSFSAPVLGGGYVLLPWIAWIAWWTFLTNWDHLWPLLRRGGWVPVLLLALIAALAWSEVAPDGRYRLTRTGSNFVDRLIMVALLIGVALACGLIQPYFKRPGQAEPAEPVVSFPSGPPIAAEDLAAGSEAHGAAHDPDHAPAPPAH